MLVAHVCGDGTPSSHSFLSYEQAHLQTSADSALLSSLELQYSRRKCVTW